MPFALRWRLRAACRSVADRQSCITFATRSGQLETHPHEVRAYALRLICYPGQERSFHAKCRNIELALAAVDGVLIAPGEVFSFWRLVGRPTERAGYARAAALKAGVLTEDVGGALCLASTLLYNVALLAGMEIIERRCHSVDSYGDRRYFELGRDAAIEYAYVDLRFRNPHPQPLLLSARIVGDQVVARLHSPTPLEVDATVDVRATIVAEERRILARADRRVVTSRGAWGDVAFSSHAAPWLAGGRSRERIDADTIVPAPASGAGDHR